MSDKLLSLIDLYELHQNLGPNEVVLDVRREDEFQQGHIPNAINIPLDQLASRVEEIKKYSKVYLQCKRGGRAKTAFESLSEMGLNNLVCIHDAGMDLWVENGYPVVK